MIFVRCRFYKTSRMYTRSRYRFFGVKKNIFFSPFPATHSKLCTASFYTCFYVVSLFTSSSTISVNIQVFFCVVTITVAFSSVGGSSSSRDVRVTCVFFGINNFTHTPSPVLAEMLSTHTTAIAIKSYADQTNDISGVSYFIRSL